MTAYIVSAGSLLEIGCPTSLPRSTEQQVSFRTALGGKRKALIRRGGRRSWSIDVGLASPLEVSSIEAVARQMGPVGWYGPEAVAGNLLSPQASSFDVAPAGATAAGMIQLPDGTIAQTVAAAGTIRVGTAHGNAEWVPVRPGQAVTVGAWGLPGARFQGYWRDAAGAAVGSPWLAPGAAHTGWQWRESTLTPPAGAVFLELQLFGGTQYALPVVSWGTTARRELGTGCPHAVVHAPSHSPVALTRDINLTDSSYSITEVG